MAYDAAPALVLLAAGGSARMGRPKQLLAYRGTSLLRHAATVALGSACRPVCVVLGSDADRLAPELAGLSVVVATNRDWATGMASSIRAGVEGVLAAEPRCEALVLMLCDQPFVTPALLDALIDAWRVSGRSLVACDYGPARGVPALFARRWFGDLLRLTGDTGARAILREHAADAALVPFPDGALDVDSPADWTRLTRRSERAAD